MNAGDAVVVPGDLLDMQNTRMSNGVRRLGLADKSASRARAIVRVGAEELDRDDVFCVAVLRPPARTTPMPPSPI